MGKNLSYGPCPLAAAIHLGWLDRTGASHRRFRIFKKVFGAVVLLGVFVYLGGRDPERGSVPWVPYEEPVFGASGKGEEARDLGLLCGLVRPCRALDNKVFSDPEIVALSRQFLAVRLDVTRRQLSGRDSSPLRHQRVPHILFFDTQGKEATSLGSKSTWTRRKSFRE